jgi:uncharacterized membrane protein
MTFKEIRKQTKEELKIIAFDIRTGKFFRKPARREVGVTTDEQFKVFNSLDYNRHVYRHKHIAYCELFNGTVRTAIEVPRENNKPNNKLIDIYKKEWTVQIDVVEETNEELEAA